MANPNPPPADPALPRLGWWQTVRTRWWVRRNGGPARAWERALPIEDNEDQLERRIPLIQRLAALGVPAQGVRDFVFLPTLDWRDQRPLRWLLAAGASPDQQESSNRREFALHKAIARKNPEQTALLLAAGANLEVKDGNGYTPLGLAVKKGNTPAIRALLEAGAQATTPQGRSWNPGSTLSAAAFDVDTFGRLLAAGADPRALIPPVDPDLETDPSLPRPPVPESCLLFRATEAQTPQDLDAFLTLLAQHGIGPHERTRDGATVFMTLVANTEALQTHDPARTAAVLLKHGHDPLACDPENNTLWHHWATSACDTPPQVAEAWLDVLEAIPGLIALRAQPNSSGLTPENLLTPRAVSIAGVTFSFGSANANEIPAADRRRAELLARWRAKNLSQAWEAVGPQPAIAAQPPSRRPRL